jgi:lantibiotic modifying enzyme
MQLLETAEQIGRRLTREAIWHEGRCNWVGAMPEEGSDGQPAMTYAALGTDLYGGTSGVALFLALLCSRTGDPEARATAVGALRQALSRTEHTHPPESLGLYSGRVGIALTTAYVGRLLAEDELVDQATRLLAPIQAAAGDFAEFDLMSGRAGALVGLLIMSDLLDEGRYLDIAVQLGDVLLNSAETAGGGYSWSSPSFKSSGNLTGFSHGTAGVAFALLELFVATGDDRYRAAADEAFAYERQLFDPTEKNWPDLRHDDSSGGAPGTKVFSTLWCHGAPGIALSRLRAVQLLDDDTSRAEAAAAIDTTRTAVSAALLGRQGNYSLCHGLAGNAEVLLQAQQVLGSGWESCRELALEVAEEGAKTYAAPDRPWPCGTFEGETAGLFLGLAGIGLFYLRNHDPTIPSVLMLQRETLRCLAQPSVTP